MSSQWGRWSTVPELEFIMKLGTHSKHKRANRIVLLRGYITSCHNRIKWNNIDKSECLKFAEIELEKEEK